MLHIIGMIFQVLLLVILCILGILLVVVCAVCFVPIRYRIRAKKEEKAEAAVKLSWLLHAVTVYAGYRKKTVAVVRVFGIPVYDRNRKKRPKKEKQRIQKTENEATDTKEINIKDADKVHTDTKEDVARKENRKSEPISRSKEEKFSFRQKLCRFAAAIKHFLLSLIRRLQNIQYTIQGICDRIRDMAEQAVYYKQLLEQEETKRAFRKCRHQLFSLWKNIKPGRLSVILKAGFEDPATLGQLLSVYGMFYPWIYRHISIEPHFEEEILEGEFDCKGHITVFVLLRAAWKIYFDKDIRYLLSMLKKEDGENG
ncbi:MAG: DUF2953 domain-containing protein [Clostridiales bacterium]|nr:DUF2953 domain-containing protein [Clostridiales bacterium]